MSTEALIPEIHPFCVHIPPIILLCVLESEWGEAFETPSCSVQKATPSTLLPLPLVRVLENNNVQHTPWGFAGSQPMWEVFRLFMVTVSSCWNHINLNTSVVLASQPRLNPAAGLRHNEWERFCHPQSCFLSDISDGGRGVCVVAKGKAWASFWSFLQC